MTIQTPNSYVAGALVDPNELPLDPFLSSEGFQEYNPAGTPLAPLGGLTLLATGQYLMKLSQGLASGEGAVQTTPTPAIAAAMFTHGILFPYDEGGAPEEDGHSIGILQTAVDGVTPATAAFTINVFRFNTGASVDFP